MVFNTFTMADDHGVNQRRHAARERQHLESARSHTIK